MNASMAPRRPTLTIGVLTKNEGHRIAACLQSAAFADEIVLVDRDRKSVV